MDKAFLSEEGEQLATALAGHMRMLLFNEYSKLLEVWDDVWEPAEKKERKDILEVHLIDKLSSTFDEILKKELETKNEYIIRVEKLLDEIGTLQQRLGVQIQYKDVENLPLHNMARRLNCIAERYRVVLQERLEKYKDLREQEKVLIESLGTVTTELDLPEIPSDAELESLILHVQAMEVEKRSRMMVFMEKRQRIIELFELLGSKPSLMFEEEVVDDRTTEFKVTNENMAKLEELEARLERKLATAQERRDDLMQALVTMWDYLEEGEESHQQLLKNHSGCTQQDLDALKAELERCKNEKSANIQKFVERIRDALVTEWDRCLVSEETRNMFRVFRISTYNEDIYDLHELELARWKKFYSDNQRIFDLYAQHTTLFEKLLELNGRGKSANRYHNRGGQLLQEEKQRKLVAKDLPRVEEELRSALANFEEQHGEPFTAFEEPLIQVLDKKWNENFDQKTVDKFRGVSLSSKSRTPCLKRPAVTSCSTGAKVLRLAPASATKNSANATKSKRCLYRPEPKQPEPDSTMILEPSYDDFQKTLRSKLGVNKLVSRSTEVLTPKRILRERTATVLLKSTKSSPALTNLPKPKPIATPKTVPRMARPAPPSSRTPISRNRLPIIL